MARRPTKFARASWFAVVLVASPRVLPAQIPDWLAPGHRVLILRTTAGPAVTGVVTSRRGDSITVASGGGEARLVGADIGQLEVSRATRSGAANGAGFGILLGVVAGVGLGVAGGQDEAASAVLLAIVFAGIGAPLGALVGSQSHHDVWTKVYPAPRARLSLAPGAGGIRAMVTLPTAALFGGHHP